MKRLICIFLICTVTSAFAQNSLPEEDRQKLEGYLEDCARNAQSDRYDTNFCIGFRNGILTLRLVKQPEIIFSRPNAQLYRLPSGEPGQLLLERGLGQQLK